MDAHRFRAIIDAAIAAGDAKRTKSYRAWAARVAKRPPPKDPLVWPPREGHAAQSADLAVAIRRATFVPLKLGRMRWNAKFMYMK